MLFRMAGRGPARKTRHWSGAPPAKASRTQLIRLGSGAGGGVRPRIGPSLVEEITVLSIIRLLLKCNRGATRLEYTLIACLTALVAFQVMTQFPASPTM